MNTRTAKGFILTNPDTDGLSGEGEREREEKRCLIYFPCVIIRSYCKLLNHVVHLLLVVCLNVLIMLFLFVEVHHSLIYCKMNLNFLICYDDKLKQFLN